MRNRPLWTVSPFATMFLKAVYCRCHRIRLHVGRVKTGWNSDLNEGFSRNCLFCMTFLSDCFQYNNCHCGLVEERPPRMLEAVTGSIPNRVIPKTLKMVVMTCKKVIGFPPWRSGLLGKHYD